MNVSVGYQALALNCTGLLGGVLRGHVTVPVVIAGFLIGGPQVGPEANRLGSRSAVLDHDAERSIRGDELARAHGGDPDQPKVIGDAQ
jgi:hypothetical protein